MLPSFYTKINLRFIPLIIYLVSILSKIETFVWIMEPLMLVTVIYYHWHGKRANETVDSLNARSLNTTYKYFLV